MVIPELKYQGSFHRHFFTPQITSVNRDSSVGIAIRYGLDGPGIESPLGGEIFRTRPDLPWGLTSLI
jgi:hypothetical protein